MKYGLCEFANSIRASAQATILVLFGYGHLDLLEGKNGNFRTAIEPNRDTGTAQASVCVLNHGTDLILAQGIFVGQWRQHPLHEGHMDLPPVGMPR